MMTHNSKKMKTTYEGIIRDIKYLLTLSSEKEVIDKSKEILDMIYKALGEGTKESPQAKSLAKMAVILIKIINSEDNVEREFFMGQLSSLISWGVENE